MSLIQVLGLAHERYAVCTGLRTFRVLLPVVQMTPASSWWPHPAVIPHPLWLQFSNDCSFPLQSTLVRSIQPDPKPNVAEDLSSSACEYPRASYRPRQHLVCPIRHRTQFPTFRCNWLPHDRSSKRNLFPAKRTLKVKRWFSEKNGNANVY